MIDFEQVTKNYVIGDISIPILRGLSFSIPRGEFVAIMGPSGSGKSTLVNILGLLDTVSGGRYVFNNQDVSALTEKELSKIRLEKIGFVFQSFNLLSRMSAWRNVLIPLVYSSMLPDARPDRVRRALFAAGLPEELWEHQSNQLSGGQMQRVAIARALVNNPDLILADEPTGNLDSETGETILKTFQDLNRSGSTIILITHEPSVAECANRIIKLKDGLIVSDVLNENRRLVAA